MNLLLAKIYLLFSLMLGVVIGTSYIQVETENLSFNFKSGENQLIIKYLNVKNAGPQKARFDISSNVSWVYVFKEGDTGAASVELAEQTAVNFVLQVNAQYAKDGVNNAEITLNAVDLTSQAQTVLDTKKINVVLNKNVASPSPSPSTSVVPSATVLPTNTPVPALTPTPTFTTKPSPSLDSSKLGLGKPVPTPSARQTSVRTIKPTPTSAPLVSRVPTRLLRPATPQPTPSVSAQPLSQKRATPLKSFWYFFRDLFF